MTRAEERALRAMVRRARAEIEPKLRQARQRAGTDGAEFASLDMMVTQNVVRMAMELAVRLAAYAISAAPVEDHAVLVALVQRALPDTLAGKIRKGAVLHARWETDGVEHPNLPPRGGLQ